MAAMGEDWSAARPATCLPSQCFASQKRQVASIRPNDRGRSEFEQGRGTIGDRGRSRARTGKKTEVTEERADEPGGPLLIVVDARRMSGAMTKCENGGGADVGSDARPM